MGDFGRIDPVSFAMKTSLRHPGRIGAGDGFPARCPKPRPGPKLAQDHPESDHHAKDGRQCSGDGLSQILVVGSRGKVTIALAVPMATLQLPR